MEGEDEEGSCRNTSYISGSMSEESDNRHISFLHKRRCTHIL